MTTSQEEQSDRFRIGEFTIDADDNTVSTSTQQRHIEPKAMQVLMVLVFHANKTVARQELLRSVWGDRVVVDEALTRVISQLRTVFLDNKTRRLIQTVPKKGYRLNAQVEWLHDDTPAPGQNKGSTTPSSTAVAPEEETANEKEAATGKEAQALFSPPAFTYIPNSMLRQRLQGASFIFAIVVIVAVVTWLVDLSDPVLIEDAPSVAVLPLATQGDNRESQYLAQGLAEQLMTALGNSPDLHVPSRYSTFAYARQYQTVREIAGALEVRYLIEGSVRTSEGSYKIVIRLIDAKQDKTQWSATYQDDESSLVGISDKIAAEVIKQLLPDTTRHLSFGSGSRVNNIEAYQAYLEGMYWLMNGKTSEWFLQAEKAFNEAVNADPVYAEAYGSLAYIYARYNYHDTYLAREEAIKKAEQAISTALSLNPENVEALLARSIIAASAQYFSAAENALDKALAISPENATALYLYSELRLAQNDFDGALEYAKKAKAQDPLSPWVNVNLAIVHYWRNEWKAALDAADHAIKIDDEYTWAYVWKAKVLHQQGRLAEAIEAMQICLRIDASSPVNNAYAGILYLEAEMPERAESLFTKTAALYGDSTDARFWKGFIRFGYQQQDGDVAIAMLEQLTLLDNRIFSLIPLLTSLYQQQGNADRGGRFFSRYMTQSGAENATVNYLNMNVAAAIRALGHHAGTGNSVSVLGTAILDEELLPHINEVFWLLQEQSGSNTHLSALQGSMEAGWPEYLWAISEPALDAEISGHEGLQQAYSTFLSRRNQQTKKLKTRQPEERSQE